MIFKNKFVRKILKSKPAHMTLLYLQRRMVRKDPGKMRAMGFPKKINQNQDSLYVELQHGNFEIKYLQNNIIAVQVNEPNGVPRIEHDLKPVELQYDPKNHNFMLENGIMEILKDNLFSISLNNNLQLYLTDIFESKKQWIKIWSW